jgi:hypothetical protein
MSYKINKWFEYKNTHKFRIEVKGYYGSSWVECKMHSEETFTGQQSIGDIMEILRLALVGAEVVTKVELLEND